MGSSSFTFPSLTSSMMAAAVNCFVIDASSNTASVRIGVSVSRLAVPYAFFITTLPLSTTAIATPGIRRVFISAVINESTWAGGTWMLSRASNAMVVMQGWDSGIGTKVAAAGWAAANRLRAGFIGWRAGAS